MSRNNSSNWITPKLKREVVNVFAPRYGRALEEKEIVEIAKNLVGIMKSCVTYQCDIKK